MSIVAVDVTVQYTNNILFPSLTLFWAPQNMCDSLYNRGNPEIDVKSTF